ncbi:MAG TPA: transcriptional repressor, partial [Phycicoccus sp.]|nr:transcriptional repressor [Phycicoccus sp.]
MTGTLAQTQRPGPSRRPTRQRKALAAVLAGTSEFRSAQELHQLLCAAGQSIGLATVYRNLQAMATEGEIDVLRVDDGEALYRACRTEEHHHHLVCRECGRTVEVEG